MAFDYVLSTRYDIIYAPSRLVVPALDDETVLVPNIVTWSDVNDMIAVGRPKAMIKYQGLYKQVPSSAFSGIRVPEIITLVGLTRAGLTIAPLNIRFTLYRHELMSEFTLAELQVIAHRYYNDSTYKIGSVDDTPARRKACIENIKHAVSMEAQFPLYEQHLEANSEPP